LKVLRSKQLSGDYSAETAREINILSYHMEVIENRLNGKFDDTYRCEMELSIPKTQRV